MSAPPEATGAFSVWCPDLATALAEPFPAAMVQTKTKGGRSISFVSWHHYTEKLNALVGHEWAMEPPIPMQAGGKLVVAVGLTILGVTRWNVGDEDADHEGYGSGATNAFAQAYKRAAALFGMGLDMYDKTKRSGTDGGQQRRSGGTTHRGPWVEPEKRPMPFGRTKNKPLGEHQTEELQLLVQWCEKKSDPGKFADLIEDVKRVIADRGESST
jgi:hypothetical protein